LGTRSTMRAAAHWHDGQINRAVRYNKSGRQPKNSERSADVRLAAHAGLTSDIARGPKSATTGPRKASWQLKTFFNILL